MIMEGLHIKQVRNLRETQLIPCPQLNFLVGKNASGKTAVLEAIFLLARGRSFRTPRVLEVVQYGQTSLIVNGNIQHEKDGLVSTGLEKSYGKTTIRHNNTTITTISEQARNVPVVLATQDSHILISGGPKQRRHWLDWAMFHVEQEYLETWKSYMKALRQRNALLKRRTSSRDLYRGWDEAMVESGTIISSLREGFLVELKAAARSILEGVFPDDLNLSLFVGWPHKRSFRDMLDEARETDLEAGYTRWGPHHADIKMTIRNNNISSVFSRGQIKLFVCLLMLAQAQVLSNRTGVKPVVLMDDYKAELDKHASEHLLTFIGKAGFQAFLSSSETGVSEQGGWERKVFHVEQGKISVNTIS